VKSHVIHLWRPAGMSSPTVKTSDVTSPNNFDLLAVCILYIGGLLFLWNARAWAPHIYIGHDQFGDADCDEFASRPQHAQHFLKKSYGQSQWGNTSNITILSKEALANGSR
jgi:hypothetical protein